MFQKRMAPSQQWNGTTGRKKDLTVSCDETKHETTSPEQDHSIPSARSNGWAECRDKKVSAPSRRRRMSLDIPFYRTFPDSKVTAVHEAPGDYPSGKKGDVLTVEFTVLGIPCLGLNGGPAFRHTEAFSFQIATENQEETDRYWNAIVGNGGTESACGWCKDRWGLSWQITPRALTDALAAGGSEAKRAFEAMMTMKKIDIAAIEAARRG